MKKKPERRYDDEWRAAVRAEARAFLAKVKARDEAARILRGQQKTKRRSRMSGDVRQAATGDQL